MSLYPAKKDWGRAEWAAYRKARHYRRLMAKMQWDKAKRYEPEPSRPTEAQVIGPQTNRKRAPCYRVLPDGTRQLITEPDELKPRRR